MGEGRGEGSGRSGVGHSEVSTEEEKPVVCKLRSLKTKGLPGANLQLWQEMALNFHGADVRGYGRSGGRCVNLNSLSRKGAGQNVTKTAPLWERVGVRAAGEFYEFKPTHYHRIVNSSGLQDIRGFFATLRMTAIRYGLT